MQLRDHLAVGLLEGPHDLLVVLEGLGRVSGPVDESPDRGLPGLHVRIIAVLQNIHLRECPFGESRPELRRYGVRYCLVHTVLLEVRVCCAGRVPGNLAGASDIRRYLRADRLGLDQALGNHAGSGGRPGIGGQLGAPG